MQDLERKQRIEQSDNIEVFVHDALKTNQYIQNFKWICDSIDSGELITLPPWLQRQLQEYEWEKNKQTRAKEYMESALKGGAKLEQFIIVRKELVLKSAKEQLIQLDNEERDVLSELIEKLENNECAKFIIIDGQSRSWLSILPFFDSKFKLDKDCILSRRDTKTEEVFGGSLSFNVKGKLFKDFPDWVRDGIFKIQITVGEIEEGSLNQITEALISKQEQVSWTSWQKIWHGYYCSVFARRVENFCTEPIKNNYEKMFKGSLYTNNYRPEQAGLERLVSRLAFWLQSHRWVDDEELDTMFNNQQNVPSTPTFNRLKKYFKSYNDAYMKIPKDSRELQTLQSLIHWVLLQDVIENGTLSKEYYKQFSIVEKYKVKRPTELKTKVMNWTDDMVKKDKSWKSPGNVIPSPHDKHYYIQSDVNGKRTIQMMSDGFPKSISSQTTQKLTDVTKWLVNSFNENLQDLKDKSILQVNQDMPSIESVRAHNDGKDFRGNKIGFGQKMDRGHIKPKSGDGDNSLENLKPQDPRSNKEYSDTEILMGV